MANSKTGKSVTSPKQWKKRSGGVDVELPSGNIAKIKRPGMEKLLAAGVMPDSLTPIAMDAVKKAQSGGRPNKADEQAEQEMLEKIMGDQNEMAKMFATFDKVTAMCVVEPRVRLHTYTQDDVLTNGIPANQVGMEIPEDERSDDILYTDEVDMDDKTFIFQYVVGGTADLESFRQQYGSALANLESGEGV
jgi:hypothetical protein